MQYKLSVHELTKTFSHGKSIHRVLSEISFDIKSREFVCIIGPSGCGKTTLLHIIGGLIHSTSGDILIDSNPLHCPNKKIGIVFQNLALFPWLTVYGNIEYGLRNLGFDKIKRKKRLKEYIQLVGLDGFESYYPNRLSGGMKQRVALARALVYDPEILLMDEPLSSLDALTKERMQTEILKIWLQTKKTILFITHDIEEAIYLSQRIIIMSKEGYIKRDILNPLPLKRSPEIKVSKEFNTFRKEIREFLQ